MHHQRITPIFDFIEFFLLIRLYTSPTKLTVQVHYLVFAFFGLIAAIQCYYYLFVFRYLAFYKKPGTASTKAKLPVSVIISARNESQNLQKNLYSILNQSYEHFEVIVVNDCSYDDSQDILKVIKAEYPDKLKLVDLYEDDKYRRGKKFALTMGIKAAQYEHLLFTDADCVPVSNLWIEQMQSSFQEKEIVLGYAPYKKYSGILNAIIRFETFYTALQYLSFALSSRAYMGVGRNLAYTKTLFFKHKGFASHMHIPSGDDDLFVNQTATKENCAVNISPESFVYSEPKKKFKSYFRQKIRHLSTGKYYRAKHKMQLSFLAASGFLFYLLFFLLIIFNFNIQIIFTIFSLRFLISGIIYYKTMRRLALKDLWWFYPFLDLVYFLIMPVWAILSLFIKKRRWK